MALTRAWESQSHVLDPEGLARVARPAAHPFLRSDEEAFKQSVECITGPVSRIISTKGMLAVYESFDAEAKKIFEQVRGGAIGMLGGMRMPVADAMLCGSRRPIPCRTSRPWTSALRSTRTWPAATRSAPWCSP